MRAVEKARLASGAGDGGVGGCIDDDLQAVRGGRGDDQGQVEHRYEHCRGAPGPRAGTPLALAGCSAAGNRHQAPADELIETLEVGAPSSA